MPWRMCMKLWGSNMCWETLGGNQSGTQRGDQEPSLQTSILIEGERGMSSYRESQLGTEGIELDFIRFEYCFGRFLIFVHSQNCLIDFSIILKIFASW